ncbi:MAG: DUF4870 domain-containing protein [[Lactobacillus] timonensis]|jgi:uncharacterized membrane protein YhaH (DUF805 family)|uniref:DUF4870 domain-containing protein n=1 Tax=[Lactobacillus] timonensis TaxID=1970790 RepID=UPI000C819511|nr:DUF4870 domain-containing protein [[Lactobacillus] timonensis]MCI1287301.1 DUF4870 domain-containing protein [[Lactobacillus] timonensis]MCI1926297.1 DUF4870 domain-containing protein [[Lactobacillus] timonensis]MCI1957664.1 DUF4870 domain-containing protein [[Lactobacillus] timonensis]MCI1970676.1 DUF4870 domain-containing protein [[Lactobacillus] timonensis]MCI2006828.1 DUF4870 domain-containing protein [[Lactobacillus] timonensis]
MNNEHLVPSTANRIIAALAYVSIIFMPVVFPLIVWIIGAANPFVKRHAKQAFWSQLIPALIGLVFLIILGIVGTASGHVSLGNSVHYVGVSMGWLTVTLCAVTILAALISFIYNIAMAVKIFVE